LCSTQGSFLVPGACHWTSHSWVTQTENTLQGQKGGGFSITNGLKAVADYGASIGNVVTSTVTLGHVQISAPYCGFGFASDVGTGFGYVALAALTGGAGGAADVAEGAETVEEAEAGAQAADDAAPMGGFTESGSTIHNGATATAIGDDPDTLQNLARSNGAAGHDVIVHGQMVDGEGQFIVDGNVTNPQQIADAVLSNPNYAGGPINLVTCYGGCGPAQELSEILGVPVNAGSGLVDLDPGSGLLREW
jgi:hypothetical protein